MKPEFVKIKFKGKRIEDNTWAYGDLLVDVKGNPYISIVFTKDEHIYHEVYPETVEMVLIKGVKISYIGDNIIHQKYDITKLPQEQIVQCHNTVKSILSKDYMLITTPTDISKIDGDDIIIVIDTKEYTADELLDIIEREESDK